MDKAKTHCEESDKAIVAPVPQDETLAPGKAGGPQHHEQPGGGAPAHRPHYLARAGARERAKQMTVMQRKVGNKRLARMLGAEHPAVMEHPQPAHEHDDPAPEQKKA
ncbi:MAG TPA: hypothetical protein VFM49_05730 [Chloroflexia bacterium]|nr:hypothetical protein [Chloroflexia bacterium]